MTFIENEEINDTVMKIKTIITLFCFFALSACEDSKQDEKIEQLSSRVETLFESLSHEISSLKLRVEKLEKTIQETETSSENDRTQAELNYSLAEKVQTLEAELAKLQEQGEATSELKTQVNVFRQSQLAEIAQIHQLLERIETTLSEKSAEDQDQATQITALQEEVQKLLALAVLKWSDLERQMVEMSREIKSRPVLVSCQCDYDFIVFTVKGSGEDENSAKEDADFHCNQFREVLKSNHLHSAIECSVEPTAVASEKAS